MNHMCVHFQRALHGIVVLALPAAAGFSTGCTSSVTVLAQFPTPLVEPLPVRMGVIFTPELYNFIHAEDIPQQSTWTIDLGDANIAMLSPLFETMFEETRTVEDVPLAPEEIGRLDGVLRPSLEKFEFDVPIGERDEFVEVWMQYRLTLYEPNGDVVVEWPVSGYGKSELDRKREEAVRRAAVVAMREVGATISTKFANQPEVSYWLEERRNESALSLESRLSD
jgi:hypothetical protein